MGTVTPAFDVNPALVDHYGAATQHRGTEVPEFVYLFSFCSNFYQIKIRFSCSLIIKSWAITYF